MSNMSHCRFENTLRDLLDCIEHLDDDLSGYEERARKKLIEACIEVAESQGWVEEDGEDDDDV